MSYATILQERLAGPSTPETELLSNGSAASSQIARATAFLRDAHHKIAARSGKLAKVAPMKASIKVPEDNVAFYDTIEESLKEESTAAITTRIRLSQFYNSVLAKMADFQECFDARNTVFRSIVENACVTLGPLIMGLIEKCCRAPNKLMRKAVPACFTCSQLHANSAVDGIPLRFSGYFASNSGSTENKNVAEPPASPKDIKMYLESFHSVS